MDKKLILGGMNQKLIEAEKDCIFYCNNCNNEFDNVISFSPIIETAYYTCRFCNSIMPIKDLKTKKQKCDNFLKFFCTCC